MPSATGPFCARQAPLAAALLLVALLLLGGAPPVPETPEPTAVEPAVPLRPPAASHVVIVSVDGLRPDAVDALGPAGAPALHRIRAEGATTDNARADYERTVTLPNHTGQITGRGVAGTSGHNWTANSDPAEGQTIHSNRGAYVASAFDVAHDAGLRTALFASKSKFALFDTSYGPDHGAPDTTGTDHGPDKVDRFVIDPNTDALVDSLIAELQGNRPGLSFLHLRDADSAGHASGWDLTAGSPYLAAVRKADRLVGRLLAAVEADPALAGRTAIVLTSDHGGSGKGHGDAAQVAHYTIPFYVWGAGVGVGTDLYRMNTATRLDPDVGRPGCGSMDQPVRNADAANLALDLLGLGDVPGSTVNTDAAPLAVSPPTNAAVSAERDADAATAVVVAPNPSAGVVSISYGVIGAGPVRVVVVDPLGRELAVLAEGPRGPGRQRVHFDGRSLPAGSYVVQVLGGGRVRAVRFTVVR